MNAPTTDRSNQLGDVLALPDQLDDAIRRVDDAGIEPRSGNELVVCGMGGSAIGADLATAAIGDRVTGDIVTRRGYDVPMLRGAGQCVLLISYSGNTEETIASYEATRRAGAIRIVATTGGRLEEAARADGVPIIRLPAGLAPRAAVGYMLVTVAEAAAHSGVAESLRGEFEHAAVHVRESVPALIERAEALATALDGSIPVIYGAGLTAPAARRWKTQINENAKLPAFWGELPEADRNEIAGWARVPELCRMSAVLLEDRDQHPRIRLRSELTAGIIDRTAAVTTRVEAEGESRTARLLWFVMLGDLVSLALAARAAVDPTPIESIDELKSELSRR